MPLVIVEAVAPTSSWRPPEAQTFHPTLPLPPYTSQVGVLGAALGLELPEAFRYVADKELKLGVGGWHRGTMRDLWKFQKLELVDNKNAAYSDIVLREHWVDTRLVLLIETQDAETAHDVREAFQRPRYPLTAGVSDALLHAKRVSVSDTKPRPTRDFVHALIYQDIAADYRVDPALLTAQPMMQSLRAPSIERIPTGFRFDDAGKRTLASRSVVTFVGDRITLSDSDDPIDAYEVSPTCPILVREMQAWLNKQWAIPVHRYESNPNSSKS